MKRGSSSSFSTLAILLIGIVIGAALAYNIAAISPVSKTSPNLSIAQNFVTLNESRFASAHIVGVSAETNRGIVGLASVELVQGRGRVLISTNPFTEPDTQQSVAIARSVAENFTGISLSNTDIIVSFDLANRTEDQVIGGPSAGIAITTAIAAAAQNKSVRSDVAMTGEILPNGTIGEVGGILEKAQAAGETGMKMFIVPANQSEIRYYEKVEERKSKNGFSVVRISYVPQTLSLDNFTQQWNMTAVEVSNFAEVAKYAIAP